MAGITDEEWGAEEAAAQPGGISDAEWADPQPTAEQMVDEENAWLSRSFESLKEKPERRAGVLRLASASGIPADVVDKGFDDFQRTWEAASFDVAKWRAENPDLANVALANREAAPIIMRDKALNPIMKVLRAMEVAEQVQSREAAEAIGDDPLFIPPGMEGNANAATASFRAVFRKKGEPLQGKSMAEVEAEGGLFPVKRVGMETDPSATGGLGAKAAAAYDAGVRQREYSLLGWDILQKMRRGEDTFELEKRAVDMKRGLAPRYYGETGALAQTVLDAAEMLPSMAQTYKGGAVGAAAGAAVGAIPGALARSPELTKKGAGLGLKWGSKAGASLASLTQEAGGAALDLLDATTDDGKPIPRDIAWKAAYIYGLAAAGIEAVTFGAELSAWGPLGDAIRNGSGKEFMKGLLKQSGFRSALKDIGKRWTEGALSEGLEEASQEAAGIVTQYAAKFVAAGELQKADVRGAAEQITEAGVKAFSGSLALGPAQAGAQGLQTLVGAKWRYAESQRAAQQVPAIAALVDTTTAQASPDAAAQLVAEATARSGAPVTAMHVDPVAFTKLFQDAKEDPQAKAAELMGPEGPRLLQEALATGSKLEVPVADYLAKWGDVAKAMVPDTTTSGGASTAREMEADDAALEKVSAAVDQKAKEIAEQHEKGQEGDDEASFVDDLERQLVATGRVTQSQAKAMMEPWRALTRTQAAAFGKSADEIFNNILVSVERGDETPGVAENAPLEQGPVADADPLQPLVDLAYGTDSQAALDSTARAGALYRDSVSGLLNRRAWDETPRTPGKLVGVITGLDAKAINDEEAAGGHDTTNDMLRTMGRSLADAGVLAARSGTNFLVEVDGDAQLETILQAVRAGLPDASFTVEGALGFNVDKAFGKLDRQVKEGRETGRLAPRGGTKLDLKRLADVAARFATEPSSVALPGELVARAGNLTPEAFLNDAYLDKAVPGVLNKAGFDATPERAHVLAIDGRGLKKVNDTLGVEAGDAFLAHISRVAERLGGARYSFAHLSGDEYAAKADSLEELQQFAADLAAELADVGFTYTLSHGEEITLHPAVRQGIGERTYGAADRALNAGKRREAAGKDVAGGILRAGEDGRAAEGRQGDRRDVSREADVAARAARAERRRARQALPGDRRGAGRDGRLEQSPTETSAFKDWFGSSKVVDKRGRPRVVYHGTRSSFDSFDPGKLGEATAAPSASQGFFFAGRSDTAETYTNIVLPAEKEAHDALFDKATRMKRAWNRDFEDPRNAERPFADVQKRRKVLSDVASAANRDFTKAAEMRQEGGNVLPVFLRLENPLIFDMKGEEYREESYNDILTRARDGGHDGAIIRNTYDAGNMGDGKPDDIFVVFKPEQIKSAIGNRGTYDPTSTNILYAGNPEAPRGYMRAQRAGLKRMYAIALNKSSDLSTFLHESAHVFLEVFGELAERPDAPERVKVDYAAALKHLGVASRGEVQREQHEKWARSFEAYLLEGKAPSEALQPAFQRFKAWLSKVYRSIAALNAPLNEEIRGVFDRLLATDAEIAQAQQSIGLTPLFRSPEDAGMTPEQWQEYLDESLQATSTAQRQLELRVMKERLREREGWWKEARAAEESAAEQEYAALPATRALRYLRTGDLISDEDVSVEPEVEEALFANTAVKLDAAAVRYALGREPAAALKRFTAKDGVNPEDITEFFAFGSTREMVEAMERHPAREGWVKQRIDELMAEKHPELLQDRDRLREVVQRGLHGEHSARWLLKEWDALKAKARFDPESGRFFSASQGFSDKLPPLEAISRAAKLIAEKSTVRRLDAGAAARAERVASEKSARAAARGNFAQAAIYKQQQLLNFYLNRELTEARDLRDGFLDLASTLSQNKARARLGKANQVYLGGSDSILEALGLKEPEQRETQLPSIGEVVTQLQSDGGTVMFDAAVVGGVVAKAGDYRAMTVAELREVDAALRNIKSTAAMASTALMDGKRVEKATLVASLVGEAARNLPYLGDLESSKDAKSRWEKVKGALASIDADLLRPETMVRWLGGDDLKSSWFRAIVLPLQQAKVREADLLKSTIAPVVKAFESMPKDLKAHFRDKVDGRKLFPSYRTGITPPTMKFEILAMALNMGNESNVQRLTEGLGITREEVVNAINETLTAEDLQWVQTVWDSMESLWPLSSDLERRMSGLAPPKIQPTPLATRHGKLRGGYYPAVYRSDVEDAGRRADGAAAAALMDPSFTRPGTSHGHLKSRVDNFAGALSLDLSIISGHLSQAIHDVAYREAVQSVGGLIMNGEIQNALIQRLGPARAATFIQWLKDVGQMRGASPTTHAKGLTKVANWMKGNAVVGVLGWSARTALGDFANLAAALPGSKWQLKPKHWVAGLSEFFQSPIATSEMAEEKSGELRTRRGQIQRELTKQLDEMTKAKSFGGRYLSWFKEHAFTFMEWSDKATSTPIWVAAYRQELAGGEGEADAVIAADALIRKLFPSHSAVDTAEVIRSKGFIGGSLMFHGYMNVAYNNRRDIWNDVHTAAPGWSTARAAAAAAATSLAFSAAAMVLSEVFSGRGPEDEEKGEEWLLRKMVVSQFQDVPFAGDVASGVENWVLGKRSNPRVSPMVAAADSAGRAILTVTNDNKDTDEKVFAALKALGPALGYPLLAPVRAAEYLSNVADGDVQVNGPLDVPNGIIYGEKVPAQR